MSANKVCIKPFRPLHEKNIDSAAKLLNSIFAGKVVVNASIYFNDELDLELRLEFSDGSELIVTGVPCPDGWLCWQGDLDIKICADERELELAKA